MASRAFDQEPGYTVVPRWVLNVAGLFSPQVRELRELLPRYEHHNRFDSTMFTSRFPEFAVTPYREGLAIISRETEIKRAR